MYKYFEGIENSIRNCQKCKLCKTRNNIVFGEGSKTAKVMVIAEAPGADEDRLGRPFVGRAGKLLDEVLNEVGLKREEMYISNIVKCRPPANRNPMDAEINACLDYLRNQVILIKPKIIVLLGSIALKTIIGNNYKITAARGNFIDKKGIKYMPTWHPAAVLRDENKKEGFISDFKKVKEELDKYN